MMESVLLHKEAARKVITQAHGREEGNGAWAVGTLNRKIVFPVSRGCFSLREGKGTVIKGNPFQDPDEHTTNQTSFLSHYLAIRNSS
jgi:hypothetical protein